jgi:RNA polymerase sigma factor (sigma-70 family)
MSLASDARLVTQVRSGDDCAFEALYARHQPALLSFCRHLTGSREDAEDAVQHTFIAAHRWIAESDDELEPRAWLFAVARNRSLSLVRARRATAMADPDIAATAFDGLADEVERREELRHLARDLARLPEPQRAALVLSQLEALNHREIGTVLEVPAAKVKALVFQARSALASAREAREAPCLEIRSEIANARGPQLRRRLLRRHVGQCEGCREFETELAAQRRDLGVLLPVAPSAGLAEAVLGGGGAGKAATAGAEAAGAGASASVGGGAATAGGGGLAGALSALGAGGAVKVALVAAVVGGGVGAAASDLPARIPAAVPIVGGADRSGAGHGADRVDGAGPAGERGGGAGSLGDGVGAPRGDGSGGAGGTDGDGAREAAAGDGPGSGPGSAGPDGTGAGEGGGPGDASGGGAAGGSGGSGGGGHGGLPPGLAKRDELPPGLAKRGELPPGLAERGDSHPGGGPPGHANPGGGPPAGPPVGPPPGHGNGGGPGNSGGQGGGQGNSGGQGGGPGNPGGQGGSPGNSGGGNGNTGQGNPGGGNGNSGQGN